MPSKMSSLDGNEEQGISPSTSLASVSHGVSTSHVLSTHDTQPAFPSSGQPSPSISSNDPSASQFLLPIPPPSVNKSQASFAYSDVSISDAGGHSLGALPPEIASADISIAPDGSFVETSSGPAARELKRRYDQHLGVGMDIRSPYAITAFINQHGKQMYRVGNRDLSAPAASANAESRLSMPNISDSTHLQAPKAKRRSRMSVHVFIPPSLKNVVTQQSPSNPNGSQDSMSSTPRTILRRTRSIPDMFNGSSYSSSSMDLCRSEAGPTTFSGRAHSHSVTAADMPRLPGVMVDVARAPIGDIFGDVMRWTGSIHPSLPSGSGSARFARIHMSRSDGSTPEHIRPARVFPQPFGPSVAFDLPSKKPATDYLSMPHMLREVQSFESGLTARVSDLEPREHCKRDSPLVPLELNIDNHSTETTPHASFIPVIKEPLLEFEPDAEAPGSPGFAPLPETSMHTRYSTDVFDVLQTYRGLPLLDRMDDNTVIKMSYQPDDTATPRDDPRFVLWGEIKVPERDDLSISQGSRTDLSSVHSSHASRRKSSKTGRSVSVSADTPTLFASPEESSHKILVAATIERWIAQLTSDLNYDELLNFFLTYRTYINAVDLCHLLICRFHWALGKNNSSHDDMVRRIVRVRTFVAIRYWLLTFFTVDFLPNRELRLSLAGWLNALIRDPILKRHSDGLSIVRKLIKVVKDCKDAHTKQSKSTTKQSPKATSKLRSTVNHVLGDKFAEATYKDADSDVDLDFLPDEEAAPGAMGGFQNDSVNAHLNAVHDGTGLSSVPKPTPVPSASAAILQRPLPLNILQQSRSPLSGGMPSLQSPASLPVHHTPLSRVFVKTIGRLGHWKRVLNSRQAVHPVPERSADVSAFDLELNVEGDLLAVRGGVERYLKVIEQQPPPPVRVSAPTPPPHDSGDGRGVSQITAASDARSSTLVDDASDYSFDESVQPRPTTETSVAVAVENETSTSPVSPTKTFKKSQPRSSSGSSSDSSFGSPIRSKPRPPSVIESPKQPPWEFDVVSIDDLDFSDTSSDIHGPVPPPPGLKKQTRKLPLRRDFEFVRRSRESVSSMGITSHRSVVSETSVTSGVEAEKVGNGLFQQWQLNAIVDSLSDNEESGDIDATLRRLEGQINPQKQQEKVSKVDGWVKTIQERMAAGDYTNEAPRFLDDEGAEDGEPDIDGDTSSAQWSAYNDNEDSMDPTYSVSQGPSSRTSQESVILAAPSTSITVPVEQNNQHPSNTSSPNRSPGTRPLPEDAVPLEILQGRVLSRPSTSQGPSLYRPASAAQPTTLTSSMSKFVNSRAHRSWILGYKAQTLVEHFSMIDRELFMGIKFEELVLDDWMSCEEVNILDWVQFLKDRARWKAESRYAHKTSALAAVRARFNLVAHFTLSEVVLAPPHDRPVVVKKFIRIAWKAYCLSNYNTLIAIMAGLQSEWVTKVMRNMWSRVGNWEKRVFDDLRAWTDAKDDFKFVRQAVAAMVDAKPINVGSHAPSIVSNGATDGLSAWSKSTSDGKPPASPGCIPFVGVYLSQLYRHSRLPDLIDPTAPNEMVGVDPETGNFDAPAHAEVFSDLAPLPPSLQLEPLINVHKQRLIADVIKMLVAGQHLASRVQYPVDKKLFQKCLKIRGLSSDMLLRAQAMYE